MDSYLCQTCGKRIDDSVKVCPDCGTPNYKNKEVINDVAEEYKDVKIIKSNSSSLSISTILIIIGILCDIVSMVFIAMGEFEIINVLSIGGTIVFALGMFLKFFVG